MIPLIITCMVALTWLLMETDMLTVRLPYDATGWARMPLDPMGNTDLPYEVGYMDTDFAEHLDFPESTIDMIWETDDPAYQAWMRKRYAPKLVYGFVDRKQDYPQYKDNFEGLDRRRNGEEIYQRGTLKVRS